MEKQVFKLIHGDGVNESFRINVEFRDQTFNLTILQKLKAWTVDQQSIRSQAKQLDLDINEYYIKIQEYFRDTPKDVEILFNNNNFTINCNLKKNMKGQYFTCKLKEADYSDCIENLVDTFYTDKINVMQRLKSIEEEHCKIKEEKINQETKLNEFIERKKTDDMEMYSNFVLILNEKKRRIQHLNELLEAFRRGRPTLNPSVKVEKRSKKSEGLPQTKTEVKKEISSDSNSNSDVDYDTDEEKQKKSRQLSNNDIKNDVIKTNEDGAIPGTSKENYDLFHDDSPPRHLLPKRIKTTINESLTINKPTTSKQGLDSGKNKENIKNSSEENTPDVNFSTQDLLDNI